MGRVGSRVQDVAVELRGGLGRHDWSERADTPTGPVTILDEHGSSAICSGVAVTTEQQRFSVVRRDVTLDVNGAPGTVAWARTGPLRTATARLVLPGRAPLMACSDGKTRSVLVQRADSEPVAEIRSLQGLRRASLRMASDVDAAEAACVVLLRVRLLAVHRFYWLSWIG